MFPEKGATTDGADNTNVWGAHAARVLVLAARRNNLFQQKEAKITKVFRLGNSESWFPLLPSVKIFGPS
jgi:hypothetical protein